MGDEQPYYFFLSYAREDKERDRTETIQTFFEDLVEAVRKRTNWPFERVGFMETAGIEPGLHWPEQLSDHLATCRAFVPILSPTYVDRTFCGREWAVFEQRRDAYRAARGRRPPLIQPVQYLAPLHLTSLPAVVEVVQRTWDNYPRVYNREGLDNLHNLHPEAEYRAFVAAFADRLKAAVLAHPLEPLAGAPDIRDVASAFQRTGTQLTATRPEATPTGPKFAQFFFVAASGAELECIRQDVKAYGDEGGLDWQPYLPELSDEMAIIAQEVASREKLRYESLPLDDDFIEAIEDAVQRNKIVVVLVDSWTVRLARYKQLMQQLDGRDFENCVIIVPWNLGDPETTGHREILATAIDAIFKKARRRGPKSFVETMDSHLKFREELANTLVAVRGQIIRDRAVVRRAESAGAFPDIVSAPPPSL